MIPPASPTRPADASWTDAELTAPHAQADKPRRVRGMFAAIAGSYDLNNRVHSLWRDQAWRRYAVKAAGVRPGDRVLDVACGTGDLTRAFADRSPAGEVVGVDFTPEMLAVAERKRSRLRADVGRRIRYAEGDAQNLAFEPASFDVVSIAFGIRNVGDPARALAEFARVLKPGGRLVVLEFDRPAFAPVRWFNTFYAGWVMPRTATWISGDRSGAYRYLPKSVGTFMTREELCRRMTEQGFERVGATGLSLGLCACYVGVRRGGSGR